MTKIKRSCRITFFNSEFDIRRIDFNLHKRIVFAKCNTSFISISTLIRISQKLIFYKCSAYTITSVTYYTCTCAVYLILINVCIQLMTTFYNECFRRIKCVQFDGCHKVRNGMKVTSVETSPTSCCQVPYRGPGSISSVPHSVTFLFILYKYTC